MRETANSWSGRVAVKILWVLAIFVLCGCGMNAEARLAQQLDYGNRYLTELNYQEAVVAFQRAIEIEDRNADAWLGYARASVGLAGTQSGEEADAAYAQAEQAYLKVLELAPEHSQAYLELADLYVQMGVPEQAIGLLESVPESLKTAPDILKLLEGLRSAYPGEIRLAVESASTPGASTVSLDVQFSTDGTEFTCTPDEDGKVTQQVPAGKYTITIQYEGEVLYQEQVDVAANEVKSIGSIPVEIPNRIDLEEAEEMLLNRLYEELGPVPIVDVCVSDYDRDGDCEAFVLVGEIDEEFGDCYGSLFFVTADSVEAVLDNEGFCPYTENGGHLMHLDECDFYLIGQYFATGDQTYVFGVRDNRWYEHEFSLSGMSLGMDDETGEITIISSQYDAMLDLDMGFAIGHTWKPYYLYWNGDFQEYGGLEISVEELLTLKGTQRYVDLIQQEGYQIDSVYYRANGVININCSYTDEYGITYDNMTLRVADGEVEAEIVNPSTDGLSAFSYGGEYSSAFLPERATYPDGFLQ